MSRSDTLQRGVEYTERLIRTIARAFYSDTIVALLEILICDKYIAEKELPIRMRLREKETSRLITQMLKERLIHLEESDGLKYYYINYHAFVNVCRYRVYLMQKTLKDRDEKNINFVCPTCSAVYSAIEAQNLKSKDHKFVCSYCCPVDNFRSVLSEPRFTLIGTDMENDTKSMERKLVTQLSKSAFNEPYHDGIFELLKELKTCQLIQNKPLDNRNRGIGPGLIADEDVRAEIEDLYRKDKDGRSNKKQRLEDEEEVAAAAVTSAASVSLSGAAVVGDGDEGADEDIAWEDS